MKAFTSHIQLLQYSILASVVVLSCTQVTTHIQEGTIPYHAITAAVGASDVVSLTNENRIRIGIPPLRTNAALTHAAQLKAEDMASKGYYAHVSPEGRNMLYWLDLVGYRYLNAGENLVIDRATSEEAVSAWMDSPTHRANILRPEFTEIGVGSADGIYLGVKTTYVVQEFGTPYPTAVPLISRATQRPAVQVAATTTAPLARVTPKLPKTKVAATQNATTTSTTTIIRIPVASTANTSTLPPRIVPPSPVIVKLEEPIGASRITTGSLLIDSLQPIIQIIREKSSILKKAYGS